MYFYAHKGFYRVVEAFQMLDVECADHMNASIQKNLNILVAFQIFSAWSIGMRQFINQSHFGLTRQNRIQIHLINRDSVILNPATSACGSVFPDGAGDAYEQICLRAKPDHATGIRKVFAANPSPSFAVIDTIDVGANWPSLRALLKMESANDILLALLSPNSLQECALKGCDTWTQEGREFLRAMLGQELKTRSKAWSAIADEVWRFVLFSEFVFDLPVDLPDSLVPVPHAWQLV